MNKKRKWILAVVVALAIAGYAFGVMNVFKTMDGKFETTIHISKSASLCTAKTEDPTLQGRRWRSVRWTISDPDKCLAGAEVELRFTAEDSPLYIARPRHRNEIKRKVKFWAKLKDEYVYQYKVWAVPSTGSPYEMEDPKLEIVE